MKAQLLLTITLALTLAACGGSKKDGTSTGASTFSCDKVSFEVTEFTYQYATSKNGVGYQMNANLNTGAITLQDVENGANCDATLSSSDIAGIKSALEGASYCGVGQTSDSLTLGAKGSKGESLSLVDPVADTTKLTGISVDQFKSDIDSLRLDIRTNGDCN